MIPLLLALPLALAPSVPALAAPAGAPGRDPAAIRELAEGTRKDANAAWWGFDESDATAALQSAIRSGASTVLVPNMGKPWIVDPIVLESDQEIDLEPGVEILARAGGFRGKKDALFLIDDKSNVTIKGYGAALRMRKGDYRKPPYEKSEWRSALAIYGGTNIRVLGLTLADSGGDGVYIAGGSRPYSKDVLIKDVVAENNYRQGISVISVDGLRIEKTALRGTEGTKPAAGIDFEPNGPTDRLVGVSMKDCVLEKNASYGLWVYAGRLTAGSPPVDIAVEGGRIEGNGAGAVFIDPGKAAGSVLIRGARMYGKRKTIAGRDFAVKIEAAPAGAGAPKTRT